VREQKWPDVIWLARHGQSAGNVARDAAEQAGHIEIVLPTRDVDVPLSELGERQAAALGRWFGQLDDSEKPSVILVSPYVRARETAQILSEAAGFDIAELAFTVDERLREKEFGMLDRLTGFGIRHKYPEQAEMRSTLGKFYYRPPGGESWCDVILRLRSVVDTITREYRRERVLIVAHQVVVNCFRYLIERMTEEEILTIDRENDVPNCSINSYEFDPSLGLHGKLGRRLYNFVAPLEDSGTEVTARPDVPVGPK
jgi:broad specificity phosphatase PhoE